MMSSVLVQPMMHTGAAASRRAMAQGKTKTKTVQTTTTSAQHYYHSSRRRVLARAQSTESATPAAAESDPESDAADGVTPAFGPGSPMWPLVHADLKDETFGKVRTVSVEEARELLTQGGAVLAVRGARTSRLEIACWLARHTCTRSM